jgi:serine/threonine-protein kinase
VAALATWAVMRAPAPAKLQPVRFAITPPATQALAMAGTDRDIAISPDGTKIAYLVTVGGGRQLMVRTIDQLDAVPLPVATSARVPFFSPDGKWIGYFDGAEIKKVSITGGPPIPVCHYAGAPRGATWGADDTIVFATSDPTSGLLRVRAGGGEPEILTKPEGRTGENDHVFPSWLPNGRAVFFTVLSGSLDNAQLAVLDLASKKSTIVVRGAGQGEYAESGHVVYAAAGTLRAARFDPVKLALIGDPVPVVDQVAVGSTGAAEFTLSRSGTLLYVPGGNFAAGARALAWMTRDGRTEPIAVPPRAYVLPRLSPDGKRIAVEIDDQENDIWTIDLSREPPPLTRLTFDPASDAAPVWTRDGTRIVFRSARSGVPNLFWRSADGTGAEERLTTSEYGQAPLTFTPDGSRLLLVQTMPKTAIDIFSAAADGKSAPEPLVATPFADMGPDLSPDGHWLAYQSNESGLNQVYVRPFPNANGGRWQVSTGGGLKAAWSPTGREIFYLDPNDGALMTAPVQTTPTFSAGTPVRLIDTRSLYHLGPGRNYDVSPDGKKLLVITNVRPDPASTDTPIGMVVVVNWLEELKERLPSPQP